MSEETVIVFLVGFMVGVIWTLFWWGMTERNRRQSNG